MGGINIIDFCKMSVTNALEFIRNLKLSERDSMIADRILKEITERLGFLQSVGLEYLTLLRSSGTLSGGESQRIRLATQIGSSLVGVLYILDEPSIGLHQRDNDKLIATLKRLRDSGNTVIVVEHDEETMRAADFIVDIGPGAGVHGGKVICTGDVNDIINCPDSITGQYLNGTKKIEVPSVRRKGNGNFKGDRSDGKQPEKHQRVCSSGNLYLRHQRIRFGKSSLVNELIYKNLAGKLNRARSRRITQMEGLEHLDKVVTLTNPRSVVLSFNPATYTGVFGDIRELYASTQDAKIRGYNSGRFR